MDLEKSIEELNHGVHLCSIYRDKGEKLSLVLPFMVGAMKKNEKCLYIVEESTKEEIVQAAKEVGLSIEKCADWGQFMFLTKEETFLREGYFTPGKMIEFVIRAERGALREGFSGLRFITEMTWVLSGPPGSEKFIEYEAKLNYFFPESRAVAVCQYNESRFKEDALADVIYTHPKVFMSESLLDNRFYRPPDTFCRPLEKEPPKHTYGFMREKLLSNAQ